VPWSQHCLRCQIASEQAAEREPLKPGRQRVMLRKAG
jgi:hypothetical protein